MFWEEPRRKPIPISLQKKLLLRCKGKCEMPDCDVDFVKESVKPHIHHIDGNPKNNKPSNLIVVCPNCHSKLHKYKTVKEEDFWGFVTKRRKLVAIKPEKLKTGRTKPTKKKLKKPKKKPKKTKRVAIRHPFWGDVIGYRTVKVRKPKTKKTTSRKATKPKRTIKKKKITRKRTKSKTAKAKGKTKTKKRRNSM